MLLSLLVTAVSCACRGIWIMDPLGRELEHGTKLELGGPSVSSSKLGMPWT